MNKELFNKHFKFQIPSVMLKTLNNLNDKSKNNNAVNLIKSGLKDLKNEIENTN